LGLLNTGVILFIYHPYTISPYLLSVTIHKFNIFLANALMKAMFFSHLPLEAALLPFAGDAGFFAA